LERFGTITIGVPYRAYTLDNKTKLEPFFEFRDSMRIKVAVRNVNNVPQISMKVVSGLKISNFKGCEGVVCKMIDTLDSHFSTMVIDLDRDTFDQPSGARTLLGLMRAMNEYADESTFI
jgi:hypothetical protein